MPANIEGSSEFAEGTFQTSLTKVEKHLAHVIPGKNLRLIPGDFTNSGVRYPKDAHLLAILNIDSDLYESAAAGLVLSQTLLQQGSVILFDEFHAFNADPKKGERRALEEWLVGCSIKVERWFDYHYSGRAFLVTEI